MNPSNLDTTFLERCVSVLEQALGELRQADPADFAYDICRAACVKEFEIILEQSGKLLRKRLGDYFDSNRRADRLPFKDLFRHAAKHGLLDANATERWLRYRDNRNNTAHDYGEGFAETTLRLLPDFVADARALITAINPPADD